jgi:hypothetical protein
MKKLLRAVYILGLLFWGIFLIYAIAKLTAYNGLGNYFTFTCGKADSLKIEETPSYLMITYSYKVDNNFYNKTEEVSSEFFHERIGVVPYELTICYNATYPNLSYIKDVNLAIVQAKTGIVVSSIFIAFISVLYLFAKRDYWVRKYQEFFKKLQ